MDRTGEFGRQIDVRPQLAVRRARLLQLVQGLAGDDWGRLTAPARWLVRDLAAHMLGDDLNRLSRGRDTHSEPGPRPGETLPDFLHPDRRRVRTCEAFA